MTDRSAREPPPLPDLARTDWDAIDEREVLDYDADTETYRASFDNEREPVREVLFAVVAVVSGTPPLELPSLSRVLDIETVEQLIEAAVTDPTRGDVHVSFAYTDWNVTVHSYGVLTVRPLQEDPLD